MIALGISKKGYVIVSNRVRKADVSLERTQIWVEFVLLNEEMERLNIYQDYSHTSFSFIEVLVN